MKTQKTSLPKLQQQPPKVDKLSLEASKKKKQKQIAKNEIITK